MKFLPLSPKSKAAGQSTAGLWRSADGRWMFVSGSPRSGSWSVDGCNGEDQLWLDQIGLSPDCKFDFPTRKAAVEALELALADLEAG